MEREFYQDRFSQEIKDPYLKKAALASLEKAGKEQANLYDFSKEQGKPQPGDLAVLSLLEEDLVKDEHKTFLETFKKAGGKTGVFSIASEAAKSHSLSADVLVKVVDPVFKLDPLQVRQHITLKMLLNAHSTCIMARMGRLVGNTMTNVSPANLKLVGRATHLILIHVNEQLAKMNQDLAYVQANAILYDVMDYVKKEGLEGKVAEVAASVVLILEVAKKKDKVRWSDAITKLEEAGSLEAYLKNY